MNHKLRVGSDFSGVGSLNQALVRLGVDYKEVFACEMDKYARKTYILNYGKPEYYPTDVYEREIPKESLDLYITTPPCQAFSLAGKRKGEEDKRGILFYNSHEFIRKNKPKYFIFENVKGLLSDDKGRTFQRWIDLLGGKSVNGNPVIFPDEDSVPYHLYYKVLNAKHYGVPQNRERIFIIGIRDDSDNNFNWPIEVELKKRLKDVFEENVDEKYFLSDKMVEFFISHTEKHKLKCNGFKFKPKELNSIAQAVTTRAETRPDDNYIKIKSTTKIGAIRGRNKDNPKSRKSGLPTTQMLEINEEVVSNCLTTVQKDNVVVGFNLPGKHEQNSRVYNIDGISPTLTTMQGGGQEPKIYNNLNIRKLTPLECFRLMDFNDDFKWDVSDSQAYKQAGNSVVVKMWELLINNLLKK